MQQPIMCHLAGLKALPMRRGVNPDNWSQSVHRKCRLGSVVGSVGYCHELMQRWDRSSEHKWPFQVTCKSISVETHFATGRRSPGAVTEVKRLFRLDNQFRCSHHLEGEEKLSIHQHWPASPMHSAFDPQFTYTALGCGSCYRKCMVPREERKMLRGLTSSTLVVLRFIYLF